MMEHDVTTALILTHPILYDPQKVRLLYASIMDSFGCIMAGSVDFSYSGSAFISSGVYPLMV